MAPMDPAAPTTQGPSPATSESPEPRVLPGQRRRRVLRHVRMGVLVVAVIGFAHLYQRFKLIAVPVESCSPILGVEPGTKLLVDTEPTDEHLFLGDLVLYALPADADGVVRYSYGRIAVPPGSPPGTRRLDDGFWLLGDNPSCPYPDSRSEGLFPIEAVAARVLFPLRF